ncbi:unnamed protein product [Candida verbasci]|uniref:Chromatin structure-remodeling complex protein RSC8 n=1 Tax=Candida verbasci TaxID=1227364 RepID=A0A9W4TUA2_9ASCO|nr:unnamed protein product [Candida verbasci]
MTSVDPETPKLQDDTTINELTEENKIDAETIKREFEEKSRNYLVDQTTHVIIPSFAKWFDLNKVHPIEKKAFQDFFSDASVYKTPESYKYIRDFMINTFRLNPKEYLTITALRRNLSGDVTNIIRIHQFLEKWGLINYQIDPKTRPSSLGPQYTGHFQITLDTPEGLVPYIPQDAKIIKQDQTTDKQVDQIKKESEDDHSLPLNLEIRRDIYSTGDIKSIYKLNNTVQYSCSICGRDSTEVRYHNLKIKSYTYNSQSTINNASILCTICYEQGLFPSNFSSSDFVKLKSIQESSKWSEEEILLLLEGIEMFGIYDYPNPNLNGSTNNNLNANLHNQWDKISEHVSTKSREQCIIKFIQLPIEDKFLVKLLNDDKEVKKQPSIDEKLVEKVVQKLIETNQGKTFLESNSKENLQNSILEQTNLINQIIELNVKKFNLKVNKINELQENLLKIEKRLNKERQQLLIERWSQFEKIESLKKERPELTDILNDLIKPVNINEINKTINPIMQEVIEDKMDIYENNDGTLPISITEPKSYQFWSG